MTWIATQLSASMACMASVRASELGILTLVIDVIRSHEVPVHTIGPALQSMVILDVP